MDVLVEAVLTALGAAAAAAAGAWYAAQYAFRKFKDERAFERSMAWFEDTVVAARSAASAAADLAILYEARGKKAVTVPGLVDPYGKRISKAFERRDAALDDLRRLWALRELYAPDVEGEAVLERYDNLQMSINATDDRELVPLFEEQEKVMAEFASLIAREGRKHLIVP